MLANFRNTFQAYPPERQLLLPQTESHADSGEQIHSDVQQRWAIAMAETVSVAGCACAFCGRHREVDGDADDLGCTPMSPRSWSHAHPSLPSTRSIEQVLYPPSYLRTPSIPPPYSLSNPPSYSAREDDAETSPLVSLTETPLSPSPPDPLAQDPSLTGVPSQGTYFSRVPPVGPDLPITATGGNVLEEAEPLPAYSRSDQRRPRFPTASDVLGPYPSLSVLCEAAR